MPKNYFVPIIVGVLLVVTVVHIGLRMSRNEPASVLPGTVGERQETWNDMRRLALTNENLS